MALCLGLLRHGKTKLKRLAKVTSLISVSAASDIPLFKCELLHESQLSDVLQSTILAVCPIESIYVFKVAAP